MPKGILPAGRLMVSLVEVHGKSVLRVTRPRGTRDDVPTELIGRMCLHFDMSEMIRQGGETRKCVGVDTTTKRFIIIEVPLDDKQLKADPASKTRWVAMGGDIVRRCYEVFEEESRQRTGSPSPVDKPADLESILERARTGRRPDRVHAPLRTTGPVGARA